jgi:hypothetical protein
MGTSMFAAPRYRPLEKPRSSQQQARPGALCPEGDERRTERTPCVARSCSSANQFSEESPYHNDAANHEHADDDRGRGAIKLYPMVGLNHFASPIAMSIFLSVCAG